MKPAENVFVFVVCGADEHIQTLNFSIRSLRKFSDAQIFVLTDISRNTTKIEHDKVIHVDTPAHFDHHQASIFIKTGIHKFLPPGNLYCYLDSDVIAVRTGVDEIFRQFVPPVRFAADHCIMRYFSPNAVNCDCRGSKEVQSRTHDVLQKKLRDLIRRHIPEYCPSCPYILEKEKQLKRLLQRIRLFPFMYPGIFTKLISAEFSGKRTYIKFPGALYYDTFSKCWYDEEKQLLRFPGSHEYTFEKAVKQIESESSFRYDFSSHLWTDGSGKKVFDSFSRQPECDHLPQAIFAKFGVAVSEGSWQHWNGGVFLFNEKSHEFLEFWHQATLEIFKDPYWKTRDQGTLISSVWKFELQNHSPLPREFNFIADYYTDGISWDISRGFTFNNFKTSFNPYFVHVYHNWGNRDWEIWRAIEEICK
jgi:hypothetical protein